MKTVRTEFVCDNCGTGTGSRHDSRWLRVCVSRALDDGTECGGPMFDVYSPSCARDLAEDAAVVVAQHPDISMTMLLERIKEQP